MTSQQLPERQKSQRILNKNKLNYQGFQHFKQKAKNINSVNELLPGLNDISDAFEALPMDLIKYFTLLKEIDAKCINTAPQINHIIEKYIDTLHTEKEEPLDKKKVTLNNLKNKVNDIIPCLEEKMHVTSVAADLMNKHLFRINNDYKLIIENNEIPESIRIGPLNHPAMIMDSSSPSDHSNPNRSAHSQRSESRREALAARKANKDTDDETDKRKRTKELTPFEAATNKNTSVPPISTKKKPRKEAEDISRPSTPVNVTSKKRSTNKLKKDEEYALNARSGNDQSNSGGSSEPTYCYCNQVSFGEMVGCDGDECKREWFHLPCIGFKNPPKGKWYCDDCLAKMKKIKRV